MFQRYYAEAEKYSSEVSFYDSIQSRYQLFKTFDPFKASTSGASASGAGFIKLNTKVELFNIISSLSRISEYLKGANTGPQIRIYKKIAH